MSNVIEFNRLECYTAEAIFGDMISIVFAGEKIWEGPVNTNGSYDIRRGALIPQGGGAQIYIYQWYFGQTKECVYTSAFITRGDAAGETTHHVLPNDDKDPNGEYVLFTLLKSEDLNDFRRIKQLPGDHQRLARMRAPR